MEIKPVKKSNKPLNYEANYKHIIGSIKFEIRTLQIEAKEKNIDTSWMIDILNHILFMNGAIDSKGNPAVS